MTINSVLFGVLATLAIESAIINLAILGGYAVAVYKKNHGRRIAAVNKGGKYNG